MNFVILFTKNHIYNFEKNWMPVDLYNFQVNVKTRMTIDEFRSYTFNKSVEFQEKWPV